MGGKQVEELRELMRNAAQQIMEKCNEIGLTDVRATVEIARNPGKYEVMENNVRDHLNSGTLHWIIRDVNYIKIDGKWKDQAEL